MLRQIARTIRHNERMKHGSDLSILDVFYALMKESFDMFIINMVKDLFTISASLDQTHLAQTTKVM